MAEALSPDAFVPGQPLGEQLFHMIARAIVSGELGEGERIRDEVLARRFHVSRMPVREALQRLERIGLLEILPSRRTVVTTRDARSVAEALEYAGYQAGIVVHASLPRLSPPERREAERLAYVAVDALDDPERASAARRDLFAYLSRRSGNRLHHSHMRDMEYAFERNLSSLMPPPEARSAVREDYRALAHAIAANDAAEAERLVRVLHGIPPAIGPRPAP